MNYYETSNTNNNGYNRRIFYINGIITINGDICNIKMTNDWEQSEDGYKTPDHWDFLYEQWKDDQMIAKFNEVLK